jgi:ABC-2 family transporter protein
MYYYVEYLRAMRALRIVGIILAIALIIGVAFRLSFLNSGTPEAYVTALENSPTAHVTRTKLQDGTTRTVIDDPQERTHGVVLRQGSSFTIDVNEPAAKVKGRSHVVSMGSFSMNEDTHGGMSHVRITYRRGGDVTWTGLFAFSTILGLLAATLLAAPLAKENDGHLELAWTKPVSREAYAGASFLVDAAAILVSQFACIAVGLIGMLMWFVPSMSLGRGGWPLIALSLVVPFAWYACLTSFSASVKRGPGMVIGMGWFAALIIPSVMAATGEADAPLWRLVHALFKGLAYLDPIVYFPSFSHGTAHGDLFNTLDMSLLAAVILTIVYIVTAVLQWRRVEA